MRQARFGSAGAGWLALSLAAPAAAEALPVAPPMPPALPSGQIVTGHDMRLELQPDGQVWLVLRYVAPRIAREGGDLDYEGVAADLDRLCDTAGLTTAQQAAGQGSPPDQILIALMDRPMPRGDADPQATVYIGAYEIGPEGCVWR